MHAIGGVLGTAAKILPFGGLGLAGALLKKKPAAAQPAPLPMATRDDARALADQRDALYRRRGGAADIVTGAYGAEAGAGGKVTLGS